MIRQLRNSLISLGLLLALPLAVVAEGSPDVWLQVQNGSIKGITKVDLYGFNGAIAATYETAWPESTVYAPLAVAMSSPYCASSDANDTAAGTGARTIRVTGVLATTYAACSDDLALNGQTSVVLVNCATAIVLNSIEVLTAGSGGLNAGIVQCGTGANTAGDPAVVHAYLPASSATVLAGGRNKTASFIYGVPASNTLICRNISAGSVFTTAASSIQLMITGYTSAGIMKGFYEKRGSNAGNPYNYSGLLEFPEKTIIVGSLAGPTGSNVGPADLTAECLLINNSVANSNLI